MTVASPAEEEAILSIAAEQIGFAESNDGKPPVWKKVKKGAAMSALRRRHSLGENPYRGTNEFLLLRQAEAIKDDARIVSYGDILLRFRDAIPKIFRHVGIDMIVLDEAQDMNPVQWDIVWDIQRLSGCSVFAVGDPRQGMYGWRGATPTYLTSYRRSFEEIYSLSTNWRSSRNICDIANQVVKPSGTSAAPIHAAPSAEEGRPVRFIPRGEAARGKAAKKVRMWMATGWGDAAILCRTHSDVDRVEDTLSENGIPTERLSTKRSAMEERAFMVVSAAARLWKNPDDGVSLRLFLFSCPNAPFGIGYALVRRSGDVAEKRQPRPILEYMVEAVTEPDSVWGVLEDILSHKNEEDIPRKAMLAAETGPVEMDAVLDRIRLLKSEGALPNGLSDIPAAFADDWEEDTRNDASTPGAGVCQIGTVHSAKGMEWDRVMVAGLCRGRFPLRSGGLEEERRILFVATTRARKELVLCEWPGPIDGDRGLFAQELFPPESAPEKKTEVAE